MGKAKTGEVPESLLSTLTRHFMQSYLKRKGYTPEKVQALSDAAIKKLMADACLYASLKMAGIESYSLLRRKLGPGSD